MSSPMFRLGAEKNLPAFWWIYTCLGRGVFTGLFFCLATQFLRWPWLSRGGEKRGGTGGLSPAQSARRTAGRSACPADSRNRQNPYRDTVENGSTLGNFGIHDPQLDAKACLPTHTFPPCWNLRKSPKRPALPGAVNPGRCRSLAPTLSPAV